jgi:radical SAM superfamily enzyme YgiQ (UPF0313 family)
MGGGVFADQLALDSPDWEFFLEKTPYIDHMMVGEGELLFLKFLQGELPGSRRVYTFKDIGGKNMDLSSVHPPDYSDFDLHYYPYLGAYTSRSCPYQCAFCSETVQWGKYRKKSASQVVKEITYLYEKFDIQLFLMGDSLLNPIVTDLANEFILSGVAVYWDGYLRADRPVCSKENTLLWRRGGFYRARLGLESGSPRVLDLMRKKITCQQIKAAVSALAYAGIKTTTYWVVGYPGETEKDFQQTLDLIEELKNDIYEAECNPFNYFASGQVGTGQWNKTHQPRTLYPENARDMLMIQTRVLDHTPSREETYRRIGRFVEHCRQLGIPNPYSLQDIYQADERWQKLHKNAVPTQADLKGSTVHIDECRYVKEYISAANTQQDNKDFLL